MSSVPEIIPTEVIQSTEQAGDYFPWSELADLEYEIWASKREEQLYNETMAKIDAEGGDISAELYPPSDAEPIVDPTQTIVPVTESWDASKHPNDPDGKYTHGGNDPHAKFKHKPGTAEFKKELYGRIKQITASTDQALENRDIHPDMDEQTMLDNAAGMVHDDIIPREKRERTSIGSKGVHPMTTALSKLEAMMYDAQDE